MNAENGSGQIMPKGLGTWEVPTSFPLGLCGDPYPTNKQTKGKGDKCRLHWHHLGLNPSSPNQNPLATPPKTVHKANAKPMAGDPSPPAQHPDSATNQLKRSIELTTLPPIPGLVEEVTTRRPSQLLPSFLTRK